MTDFTGLTFDRYQLLESAGEGGMASVYKAYDTRLERDVAVKIIRTDMFVPAALQQVLKRFEREAKSLAKLSHPNIVSVIDYGDHDGVPYLVMEYLPGGSLKDRLKEPQLTWQDSFHLLLPIARALQFSHQQGIIHRDVKPSNILITLSGEPMLSDFGIARILESEGGTNLTGTGVGIGTPEYMAPEQWVGKTSPQSDLYSLGVVLYEMVTGRKPYTADTPAAILLKQANDPLPRPRQFTPDLPASVEKIILKALAKNPENRYQNMGEFITAMESLLGGQTRIKQPTVLPEKSKTEKLAPAEPEALPGRVTDVDQATLIVRVPVEEKPVIPAAPAAGPLRTSVAPPGTPPYPLEVPPLPQVERAEKKKTIQLSSRLLGMIKNRPAWIIGLAGLVGLVAVIAIAVWGVRRLATPPAGVSVSGGIVYYTSDQSGIAEIYYLDRDAKSHRVTYTPDGGGSWSPAPAAGGIVYYTSDQSGFVEIYYLDLDAKSHRVTNTPDRGRSWSPAPAAGGIVYYTSDQSGVAEIYYLDQDAKSHRVTNTPNGGRSWSPAPAAGGVVYYTSDQSGIAEIYYLDQDAKSHRVTNTPDGGRSWSPAPAAGGIVYYTSDQSGVAEIYYLDQAAKSHRVTHTPDGGRSWLSMYGKTPDNTHP
jgi:serine/threonine protein kinase